MSHFHRGFSASENTFQYFWHHYFCHPLIPSRYRLKSLTGQFSFSIDTSHFASLRRDFSVSSLVPLKTVSRDQLLLPVSVSSWPIAHTVRSRRVSRSDWRRRLVRSVGRLGDSNERSKRPSGIILQRGGPFHKESYPSNFTGEQHETYTRSFF